MTRTTRIGVAGAGYWGRNVLRNFHALGALAAVCDNDRAALGRAAKQYPEVTTYPTYDALLADSSIDGVSIATPAATHGDMVLRALSSGKHVLVEKPLCLKVAQAETIRQAASETGRCLMVGHLLLYHPAFLAAKRAVEEGRLGSLRYIYSNRLSLGKIRREESSLWSFAPHDVSMILALVGALPVEVATNGGAYLSPPVADTTLSHLKFKDGIQAHIFVSWLHPYKDHRMVIVGSSGMIVFDDVVTGEGKLLFYPHLAAWDGELPVVNKATAIPVPYENSEPLANECRHFLDSIVTGRRPVSDVEEGLRVLTVLDACERSLASGQPVSIGGDCS